MKRMPENRNEKDTSSKQKTLRTIEDRALLDEVAGGPESVHMYLTGNRYPNSRVTGAETILLF